MPQQGNLPEIRKTIVLQAPIEKAWKAIATSEGIAAWWMANTFEPVVGHRFILQSEQFGDSPCLVTEIEPMHCVGFDWGKDWHLRFQLQPLEDGVTEFTLIHSGWDDAKTTEFGQPHAVIRNIMNGGWDSIVNVNLVRYVGGLK